MGAVPKPLSLTQPLPAPPHGTPMITGDWFGSLRTRAGRGSVSGGVGSKPSARIAWLNVSYTPGSSSSVWRLGGSAMIIS